LFGDKNLRKRVRRITLVIDMLQRRNRSLFALLAFLKANTKAKSFDAGAGGAVAAISLEESLMDKQFGNGEDVRDRCYKNVAKMTITDAKHFGSAEQFS
jgi:hypothetical protein